MVEKISVNLVLVLVTQRLRETSHESADALARNGSETALIELELAVENLIVEIMRSIIN